MFIKKYFINFCFFLLAGMLFNSCSKTESEGLNISDDKDGMVVVEVGGVEDFEENSNINLKGGVNKSASTSTAGVAEDASTKSLVIGDFSLEVNSEQFNMTSEDGIGSVSSLGDSKLASGKLKAATVPIGSKVKYWLLIYNTENDLCVYSKELTASLVESFSLPNGVNYRWYAYSYNDNVAIPSPDNNNPVVETKTDKPFLYANGSFTTVKGQSSNLKIIFKHKLTQLKVQISAASDAQFANVSVGNVKAEFVKDYLKTSDFNIKTGVKTISQVGVSVGDLKFSGTDSKVASGYYTADESITEYQVKIREINLNSNTYSSSDIGNNGVISFSGYSNVVGKVLLGRLNIVQILPIRRILHYGPLNSYGLEAWDKNSASGKLIRDARNYGPNSNYVKIKGLAHSSASNSSGGSLANAIQRDNPHIIIASISSSTSSSDYNALLNFVRNGGYVLMMSSETSTTTRNFLRTGFGDGSLTLSKPDASGSVYKWVHYLGIYNQAGKLLKYIEPFGNSYSTVGAHNSAGMTYLSYADLDGPIGYTYYATNLPTTGARLKKIVAACRSRVYEGLNYIGDSNFLASNGSSSYTSYPFVVNSSNLPASKAYGSKSGSSDAIDYDSRNKPSGSWRAENSKVFANIFAWMLYESVYVAKKP